LAGDSPRAAFDTFIERFQRTLACVGETHVAGDGYELERPHSIAMRPYHPGLGDRLQLQSRATGQPDLMLDVIHEYTIVRPASVGERGPYQVRSTLYRYQIYDLEGTELLLYHWHPDGLSSVTTPHMHAPCAPRISLPRPRTTKPRQVDIGRLHLPTNHILLEDIIELLIRDLGIEPRPEFRDANSSRFWEKVLRENRAAVRRDSARP